MGKGTQIDGENIQEILECLTAITEQVENFDAKQEREYTLRQARLDLEHIYLELRL